MGDWRLARNGDLVTVRLGPHRGVVGVVRDRHGFNEPASVVLAHEHVGVHGTCIAVHPFNLRVLPSNMRKLFVISPEP